MSDTDVEPTPAPAGEPLLDLLNGFIVELREAGLPVSLTENLDAMEAIRHIPLEDRDALKYALAATLVKNNAHWRSFETVFEVYFSLRGSKYAIDDDSVDPDLSDLLDEDELVASCMLFLFAGHDTTAGLIANGLYNLGTGKARSFQDLAANTFRAMGLEPNISFIDTPGDIRATYQYFTEANMSKLREAGYEKDFYSLEEGIEDYVKGYLLEERML